MSHIHNNEPVITIIMPVYNDAERVERCLESLRTQTFSDFEVIMIDDGSTDSTVEVLRNFSHGDHRFILVQASRLGAYGCRNIGLDRARGKYIGFIDSDDWVKPEILYELAMPLENEDIEFTLCSSLRYDENTKAFTSHFDYSNWPEFLIVNPENIHQINGGLWNKLYRKRNIDESGLRFPEYRMAADVYFNWAYFVKYPRGKVISSMMYVYTIRNGSIVTTAQGYQSLDAIRVYRDLKAHLKKNNQYKRYENSFFTITAKSLGPRFMRERLAKILFLIMTLIWIGPGLWIWGFTHWKEYAHKIKRY